MAEATKTSKFKHVEYIDVDGDNILEQVLVVKRWEDGTINYIDIDSLDNVDKGRIKTIISSPYAVNLPCWELLAQARLSNGMNALDYFHPNLIKTKSADGSIRQQRGPSLESVRGVESKMIGSDFSNPSEAVVDSGGNIIS